MQAFFFYFLAFKGRQQKTPIINGHVRHFYPSPFLAPFRLFLAIQCLEDICQLCNANYVIIIYSFSFDANIISICKHLTILDYFN